MKRILIIFLFLSYQAVAQTPTFEPVFFAADQEITITYNVSGSSLASLSEAWIWMWVENGSADNNAPSNVNPANSNPTASDPAKFTKTVNGSETLFSITITPTVFLNQTKELLDSNGIGMLLKGNDFNNGQTEDFNYAFTDGFSLILSSPTVDFGFVESGQEIIVSASTSQEAQIDILIDDNIVSTASSVTQLTYLHTIIDDGESHKIRVTANNGSVSLDKDYTYILTPTSVFETLPTGMRNGINYLDEFSATLVLEAPNKEHVFAIGDFNDWSVDSRYQMKKDGDRFWTTITGLTPGQEYIYQYLVDGQIRIADPYTEKVSSQFDDTEIITGNRYPDLLPYPTNKTSEAASYLQTNQPNFAWTAFERPANEDLMIYELLIRDFTDERTYSAVTDRLDYLQELGFNALELMPVQEFEGNLSWGYNPSSMFAIDKYYGTELDLKTLVDEAHQRGIAVILDIVLNHQFGRNSLVRLYNEGLYGKPLTGNPWFNVNAKHDFNVGYDMNHESQYTKNYIARVATYWLEEYNVDGYRFDLSKGFTQKSSIGNVGLWGNYDATRVAIWKRLADVIWNVDPEAYIILEHFADNTEEKELADYGMMLWGNLNSDFRKAANAKSVSLAWLDHVQRGWDDPHVVGYMESHDEERLMWDLTTGSDAKSVPEALNRAKLAAAFFLTVPGPKMVWQFGEMGYDEELNNDRLGIKPTHWEYLEDPDRVLLFDLYKSLINLRTKTNYITTDNFSWSTGGWVKTINIDHPDVSIRIIGNFDDEAQTTIGTFNSTGTWFDFFTGQEKQIDIADEEIVLGPGQFFIYTSEKIENYIDDRSIILSTQLPQNEVVLYPNPTEKMIMFETSQMVKNIVVKDLHGRTLKSIKQLRNNQLNIEELVSGVFLIEYQLEEERFIKKVIKE